MILIAKHLRRRRKQNRIFKNHSDNYMFCMKMSRQLPQDKMKSLLVEMVADKLQQKGRLYSNLTIEFFDQDSDNFVQNTVTVIAKVKAVKKMRLIKKNFYDYILQ